MKKVSAARLEALKARGAKVTVRKPPESKEPEKPHADDSLAQELAAERAKNVELTKQVQHMQMVLLSGKAYRHRVIERDERGDIYVVESVPVTSH